jgi:hypothetical protein
MRREFQLGEEDEECLQARGLPWEAVVEKAPDGKNVKWIIFHGYPIPEGYNHRQANAVIRLGPSYPDDDIDMVYFSPELALTGGRGIKNLSLCTVDGKQYQQWSRHRTKANPWRPGVDNICSHMLQVDDWLRRELK